MRKLIIYDHTLSIKGLISPSVKKGDELVLFPLTSLASATGQLRALARSIGFSLTELETAQLINASADKLRSDYLDLITSLGLDVRHKGKNLREWFAVDDVASMWWMSLVAEKNTFKSDAFNILVQCDAVIETIGRFDIRSVILAVNNPKLVAVLKGYLPKKDITCTYWPVAVSLSVRKRVQEHQSLHFIKHVAHLLIFAASFFLRTVKIKKTLKDSQRRLADPGQLMLINAFPYFDQALAAQGVFRNKQFDQLQLALEQKKEDVLWAVFYVNNETVGIDNALDFAKKFIANGYNIYFIEEGCSVRMQLRALVKLLTQAFKFLTVESTVAKRHQWEGYNFYPIFKDEWYRSFVGPEAYHALLFYEMFQDLLKKAMARKAVYCCEMQSWEKALIFAKKKVKSAIPLLAYQHTTVSYMLLNYFSTPMEINSNGRYAMAQPDKLICNGRISYDYMKKSGWALDRLAMAEAVRFEEFKGHVRPASVKENVVLLAFSISVEESSSLLNIVLNAFQNDQNVKVWIKPHPFVKIERIFQASGLLPKDCPFEIKNEPIEELLAVARIAVVGESSVSLQALLFGCEVMIVNVPEWINMSPLKGFSMPKIHVVNTSRELQDAIGNVLNAAFMPGFAAEETSVLVDQFFLFNKDSEAPDKFLELLRA